MDEQYTRALCDWVATLVEPSQRPCRRRSGQGGGARACRSSTERGAPPDGAEAAAAVEPAVSKRAYHQPSRELRNWVVDYALLRLLQGWDHLTIAQRLSAWLPHVFSAWMSTRTVRRWLQDHKKEGRQPRDACDVLTPILREVRPRWRGRRSRSPRV